MIRVCFGCFIYLLGSEVGIYIGLLLGYTGALYDWSVVYGYPIGPFKTNEWSQCSINVDLYCYCFF